MHTIWFVVVTFDAVKSEKNARDRGLPFTMAADIDFATALAVEDTRHAYPERRFILTGWLGAALVVCCYTPVPGGLRVISLRRANARERKRYAEEATHPD